MHDEFSWGDDDNWWQQQDLEMQQQAEAAAQEIQRNLMALQMCLAEIEYQIGLMEGRKTQ
jgi:hypothetical protein